MSRVMGGGKPIYRESRKNKKDRQIYLINNRGYLKSNKSKFPLAVHGKSGSLEHICCLYSEFGLPRGLVSVYEFLILFTN